MGTEHINPNDEPLDGDQTEVWKAGVKGQSGDLTGHDFRGNQWWMMGPNGVPVRRPKDPVTGKPLKGQAAIDALARQGTVQPAGVVKPSKAKRMRASQAAQSGQQPAAPGSTPRPTRTPKSKPAAATPAATPAQQTPSKPPKPTISAPAQPAQTTPATTPVPTSTPPVPNQPATQSQQPTPVAPKPSVTPAQIQPVPNPVAATPVEQPKETKVEAPAPAPVPEPEADGRERTPDGRVITANGMKPIAQRCAEAEQWKPETEVQRRAYESGVKLAKRLYVPKERQALFAVNLTKVLTDPAGFKVAGKAARETKSGADQWPNAAMLIMLGYTGLPQVVGEDAFRAAPGKTTFSGIQSGRASTMTVQEKLATLYAGPVPRYGHNMFGVAFYTGNPNVAASYSGSNGGKNSAVFRVKMADPSNEYIATGDGPLIASDVVRVDAREDHGTSAGRHPDYQFEKILTDAGYDKETAERVLGTLFGGGNNITKSITPALAGYDSFYDQGHSYRMVLNRGAMVMPDTYVEGVRGTDSFSADGARGGASNVPFDATRIVHSPAWQAAMQAEIDANNSATDGGDGQADSASTVKPTEVEKGDRRGHEFRGNQWKDVASESVVTSEPPKEESPEEIVSDLSGEMKVPEADIWSAMTSARPFVDRARLNEPPISAAFDDVVAESGGTAWRRSFALKSLKSATEKTVRDSVDYIANGASPEEAREHAAAEIHDLVRYTATWPLAKYAKGVNDFLDGMRARGFTVFVDRGQQQVKNYMHSGEGNTYRGINANLVDPNTGQVFEVQFHTVRSLRTAERMHDFYEGIRKLPKDDPRYVSGCAYMEAEWNAVPIPPGSESIGFLKLKKARIPS